MKRAVTLFGQTRLNPIFQAGALLVLSALAMLIANSSSNAEDVEWMIAACTLLFFATANPIIGIFKKQWLVYIAVSFVVFALLLIADILIADQLAERKLSEVTEYRLIFFALAIFYVLITFLIGIFRTIVNLLKGM